MNCFGGKFDKCFNVANNLHDDCMKTYGLWRPVMDGAKAPIHCQLKNRLLTQWQLNILHYSRLWCTILQLLPNQSYTIAYMYSSLIVAMSLQLTKNHSIILVPMEETLLHKLESTQGVH